MTRLRIDYIALTEIEGNDANPKGHDRSTIAGSLNLFGYVDPIILDERTGRIISGHGRRDTLLDLHAAGGDPPDGIEVGPDGTWSVPVVAGWRSASDEAAKAALVALNRTTELGGWNDPALVELLDSLGDLDAWDGIGYDSSDLDELRTRLGAWTDANVPSFTPLATDADETRLDQYATDCPACGATFDRQTQKILP